MKALLTTVMALSLLICNGCAGSKGGFKDFLNAGPWWQAAQTEDISQRAREWESRGEFNIALQYWQLVSRIAGDPTEAEEEIERLKKRIDEAVRGHYQKGLRALRNKQATSARDQFLAALRLDPDFQPALRQIRLRYATFPLAVYPASSDDTPVSVARKVFDDDKKAFLVAWFNQLSVDEKVKDGELLLLPKLEKAPEKTVPGIHPPDILTKARERMVGNDLEGALTLAMQADTSDPDVKDLINAIQLRRVGEQIASGHLDAAELTLSAIPDEFEGKSSTLVGLHSALEKRKFDADLAGARDAFKKGQFTQSLERSERLLEMAPEDPEVRQLVVESRYRAAQDLVDKGRYLEAREMLSTADATHDPSTALKEAVRIRLVKLGQMHYRNGVKHFINEQLDAAIGEWEKALDCNPDLTKAREDITIARRLLKKIQTMP